MLFLTLVVIFPLSNLPRMRHVSGIGREGVAVGVDRLGLGLGWGAGGRMNLHAECHDCWCGCSALQPRSSAMRRNWPNLVSLQLEMVGNCGIVILLALAGKQRLFQLPSWLDWLASAAPLCSFLPPHHNCCASQAPAVHNVRAQGATLLPPCAAPCYH